jgi:peptide/nickel transport system substrate-binding protein
MSRILAGCLLAAAAAAASCTQHPQAWAGRPIVIALGSSPTNLDPGIGLDETSQRLQQLIFSSLLNIDDHLRNVPDLATRFETTDHQTYVAAIPSGVRFHDGREMTSADLAYTFRRFLDPAFVSGRKGAYTDLASVEILDRYTVAFHLKRASTAFPSSLTNMGIVPAGAGAALARHPIGSGPYRLTDFVPDDHVALAPFDAYYQGRPPNDGLLFRIVPDQTMRGLELRKGDVDLVVNDLSPDLVYTLGQQPGLTITEAPGTDFAYIGLNLRDPILADRRVRQAIGYAVDRTAIVEYLRRRQAREAAGLIPSMSWAFADDLFHFTYDPARARALLDDAGHPDPDGDGPRPRLHLTLKTSTDEAYRLQAAVLQNQLAHVGIDLEIRSYEFTTLFADIVRGNVQLYTLVFTSGAVADPDILRRVFYSTQVPPNGFNRAHYANPEVDRLLDDATVALTDADRRRYYVEAQRLIAADAPIISLWARTNVAVAQSDVRGVSLSPIGDFDFLRHISRAD